jgi:AcrR family transcriptional regulator
MSSVEPNGAPAADTRQRLIDTAVRLFRQHSFAGTSLQMISEDLGLTKSAIYHHFRTREELLSAVIEPMLMKLAPLVEDAETQRTPRARAERMLNGFAALAAANRSLISVLTGDPGVVDMLRNRPEWGDLVSRQMALLAGVEPGPNGRVKAAIVMSGISAAAQPGIVDLDDEALLSQFLDTGRRTLGLRTPKGAH